jgi:hypothetical protein
MGQRKRELPPEVAAALGELKAALADIYGERLRGVYLPIRGRSPLPKSILSDGEGHAAALQGSVAPASSA